MPAPTNATPAAVPAAPAPPPPAPSPPLKEIGVDLIEDPGLWFEEVLTELSDAVITLLPDLISALALLVVGWLGAFLLRWLIHRFGKGLDAIMNVVHRRFGQKVTRPRWSMSAVVGDITFWVLLAYVFSAAAEQVGLNTLSNWILGLLGYLPRVMISILILMIGYLVSEGVRKFVVSYTESIDYQYGVTLGYLVSGLILAFTLLLGLAQLGLDVTVFANIITLAAAALFASIALAFGLGAADSVRNVMASHYVRKAYRPGQRVRIEEIEGDVIELSQVYVTVETDQGEARIPPRYFLEHVTLIVDEEESSGA
jgi:small-conductance mechanosensitive channel